MARSERVLQASFSYGGLSNYRLFLVIEHSWESASLKCAIIFLCLPCYFNDDNNASHLEQGFSQWMDWVGWEERVKRTTEPALETWRKSSPLRQWRSLANDIRSKDKVRYTQVDNDLNEIACDTEWLKEKGFTPVACDSEGLKEIGFTPCECCRRVTERVMSSLFPCVMRLAPYLYSEGDVIQFYQCSRGVKYNCRCQENNAL